MAMRHSPSRFHIPKKKHVAFQPSQHSWHLALEFVLVAAWVAPVRVTTRHPATDEAYARRHPQLLQVPRTGSNTDTHGHGVLGHRSEKLSASVS